MPVPLAVTPAPTKFIAVAKVDKAVPSSCTVIPDSPAAAAIVTAFALFLVSVTLEPAVSCTTELSLPVPDVKFMSTLLLS